MRLGDAINYVVLVLTVLYAFLVVGHAQGFADLSSFGKNWDVDGFCLSFKGTWYHSHLLCFYTDTLWALFFLYVVKFSPMKASPSTPFLSEQIGSVFMHGLGHSFLWYYSPLGSEPFGKGKTFVEFLVGVVGGVLFFHMFFRGLPLSSFVVCAQSLFHALVMVCLVPPKYLFTYVNTALFLNITGSRVLEPPQNKDASYDLAAVMVGLPIMTITWLEPLTCDTFLVNWGGHLFFDFTIPFCAFCYFLVLNRSAVAGKQE